MRAARTIGSWGYFWIGAFAASLFLASQSSDWAKALDMRWITKPPRSLRIPMKSEISDFMDWLVNDATFGLFTFTEFTRSISWLIEQPYLFVKALLVTGWVEGFGDNAVQILPSLSWIAVITAVFAMGYYARNWRLGAFVALCFLYLAVFGQWDSAMVTLSSILIAVPIGVAGGLLLGIFAYRSRTFNAVITPVLDLMQTVPIFAYLVPILFLFGFSPVAALIATIIYAMPPMVRITTLALKSVPEEIREFGVMAGCSKRQMMWKILVPAAMRSLMVGVNQVIMLSLNMVIIASMIGAGGLGYDVLTSLRRLDIGSGLEAGVAIVALAIALDRLSQAFSDRTPADHGEKLKSPLQRHPWLLTCALVALGTGIIGLFVPAVQTYPSDLSLTTGDFWSKTVEYINVNYFDQIEAVKTFILITFLVPVKRFLLELPWPWTIALLTLAGWQFGRLRLAALIFAMCLFIVVNGLWAKAMVTVYLVGVSVVIASMIGIPIGIWAAQNRRVDRIAAAVIDTLQTLPSFVYLIPVVMLFRVGDFSAMIAVVLYALAPAVRYAAHGIKSVDPQLIDAGIVSGCTKRQLMWRIRLPLALPEIMLGINQTIMLAISMLVITALVGTRELGQEVYIALTKADTGRGIVAGLAIAFIAIIADRLIAAGAGRARQRLGLEHAR